MKTKSILLIEDNGDLRSAAKELFEFEGFEVKEAEHGAEALDLLKNDHNISLIFLDLNMPVMNGKEFLKAAQGENLLSHIKVIIFATFPQEDLEGDFIFIKKPANIDYLLSLAQQYCQKPSFYPMASELHNVANN